MRRAIVAKPQKGDRGLRIPQWQAGVRTTEDRLQPWMMMPVLPNERLVGGRFNGQVRLERMIQPLNAPESWAEVAVWYVPMSALPDWMTRWAIVADGEDIQEIGQQEGLVGDDLSAEESITDEGLQRRNRIWAGEIGSTTGDNTGFKSRFMPYTSNAVYAIAQNWYEMEIDDLPTDQQTEQDISYGSDRPQVSQLIRGALPSGVTAEDIAIDSVTSTDLSFDTSIADWAHRLSLMTRRDETYAEYLASHGVNPRFLDGIPQPLSWSMVKNRPMMVGNAVPAGVGINASFDDVQGTSDVSSGVINSLDELSPGTSFFQYADDGGLAPYGADFTISLPDMELKEPGFLVGTVVWHQSQLNRGKYAEHMTANHMIKFPKGGVGGYDEIDFLTARSVLGYDATNLADLDINGGVENDEEGRSSNRAINLLNLFINGDTFSNRVQFNTFDFRTLGGTPLPSSLREMNVQVSGEMAIASHLVNAS